MGSMLLVAACLATLSAAASLTAAESRPSSEDGVSLMQQKARVAVRSSASDTPLTVFRDAVVRRPTPPQAFEPIPEIKELEEAQSAKVGESLCVALLQKLNERPLLQEPIFIQRGDRAATKAMATFADDEGVQISCATLLSQMAQWNWVLAHAMAREGAIEAIVTAMKHFPDNAGVRALAGALGAFTDFDQENKRRLMDSGLVELVYKATDQHYTLQDVAQMYNLWSTLCNVPEVAEQMVQQYGELERGVRAMKSHRRGTVRGEVIQVHSTCFTVKPSWKERSFNAGIVPEILSAIRDEISGAQGELDAVGRERLVSNSLNWLRLLAEGSPERRTAVLATASDELMHVIQDSPEQRDPTSEHRFAEMQHDLRSEACGFMTQLMGDTPAERQQFAQAGSLPQLHSVLKAIDAEGSLSGSCVELLRLWPQ